MLRKTGLNIFVPASAERKTPISIFAAGLHDHRRNFRSPNHRGELDLVGWDRDVLCFIEVKARTTHAVKPAEAAVDRYKQRELYFVARDFLRQMPPSCQWRFDVLSVYYDRDDGERGSQSSFELF